MGNLPQDPDYRLYQVGVTLSTAGWLCPLVVLAVTIVAFNWLAWDQRNFEHLLGNIGYCALISGPVLLFLGGLFVGQYRDVANARRGRPRTIIWKIGRFLMLSPLVLFSGLVVACVLQVADQSGWCVLVVPIWMATFGWIPLVLGGVLLVWGSAAARRS